jgi:hypothetical protein
MPSIRKRGGKWMVIYRDAAGRQCSAGSFGTEPAAKKVLKRTVDGVTLVEKPKSYSAKSLAAYVPVWLAGTR